MITVHRMISEPALPPESKEIGKSHGDLNTVDILHHDTTVLDMDSTSTVTVY